MSVPILFNRQLVRLHRDRAVSHMQEMQDVVERCADQLLGRLDDVQRSFANALEIGGRGIIGPALQARGINTISADLSHKLVAINQGKSCVCMDEEMLPFAAESFDLVIAHFNLHWVNDLPGALMQIRNILRPDGLFLAAVPILPTLSLLRTIMTEAEIEHYGGASPRISPFPDLRACAELMQRAGFALPVVDKEKLDLVYRSAAALFRDLRFSGETNALVEGKKNLTHHSFWVHCLEKLEQQDELAVPLHFAVLTGWAPDVSQPQPLKPGQFSMSLENVF
ncbi:class I SAM-dependent methyltransferase [Commensalibacter oyaizuii]|uniref:Methyltransferase domain-containing protein n=1 Tax=Commensalibacter oyaizuii TaxID=3043873 RepID=A0ABT6Q2V3_9PROT|nr:class I SAM-dependent methyltransferase [Commensalibacter sp. TBRC 16381]MDI2090824.1 methyltransferase domain-containing protein [Commensalibacter sp. TBRC 16381]